MIFVAINIFITKNLKIMKKTIMTMTVVALMTLTTSISYGQTVDKKTEKARENVQEAKKEVVKAKHELKEAQMDSVKEYNLFKQESEVKIKHNEKRIAELKLEYSKLNSEVKVEYQKKLAELEQKNTELNGKLKTYKINEDKKWKTFKKEFSHDMDELGKALKDFTVKNNK